MNSLPKGWFSDVNEAMWPGQALSHRVEEQLFHQKSEYQDVMVFRSSAYGNILVIDGVVQVTEKDECAYAEMAAHIPINCHPNPERVLIIGGGDGGIVREVVKHPKVKQVTMCEIDQVVIDACKKYLPLMAAGFDSPKLELHIGDGFEFMKKHSNYFDVIITDCSDESTDTGEEAPAAAFFKPEYHKLLHSAVRDGGLVSSQCGDVVWFDEDRTSTLNIVKYCQEEEIFKAMGHAIFSVPTYPGGEIGILLASKDKNTKFRKPLTRWTDDECDKLNLQYYSTEMHESAFALPRFVKMKFAGTPLGL